MRNLILVLILFPTIVLGQCWQFVDAGSGYMIAIKPDGTLWSWGNNDHIKLGWNNATPSSSPGKVGNNANWVSASAGSMHSAAINSDGKLFTFGNNTYGECGDGHSGSMYPANSILQIGTENWSSVSCGSSYTLIIKSDGTLWSTGDNSNGKCGRGTSFSNSPAQIGTDNNWKQVSANGTYSLGLKYDGTLWFWGFGYQGNGAGMTTNNTPVQIGTATDWDKLATRGTFALKTNGTLWGWGNSSLITSNIPVQIGTDTNWKTVSSSSTHVMATKTDNTLWLWGNNSNGQLGNGTINNNFTPTQLGADTNWTQASAGSAFSVALKADGSLVSCGMNVQGVLGLGNNIIMSSNVTTFSPVICSTLITDSFSINPFRLHPNPVNKLLFLENSSNIEIDNITVIDLTGKIVLKATNSFSALNIETLENGVYLIEIKADNKNYTYKVVKI